MRIVFLGTSAFAVPAFQILLQNSYEICGAFTQPDRPSGRGQKLHPTPIKILAQEAGIPVFQPARIRDDGNRPILEELRPDFLVVASYGQIMPGWLLQAARIAPVNIHGSLLPRYRGAAPIAWAILNGETVTGVTTMVMQEELDSGPILLQQEIPIPITKTAGELEGEMAAIGANLLIKTLDGLSSGVINPIMQDTSKMCWAPRLTKDMAKISWQKRALDIHNQVRALNPWPIACADFRGEQLRIWRSLPMDRSMMAPAMPGTFLGHTQGGIQVQCGEGTGLEILEVQRPAKKTVSGREFANGAHLHAGDLVFV